MATARFPIVVAAILVAVTQFVFGAPVIEGIALCKQPLPGDKEAHDGIANLVLVTLPGGKPVRLFPKTPASIPPRFGAVDAHLLDDGRLVVIDAAFSNREANRYGYMILLFDPATGKLSTLTEDAARDSVVVSPDRKTMVYSISGSKGFKVWQVGGRRRSIEPPKGYEYSVRRVAHAPHLLVTRSRRDGKNTRHFWLNEARGTLTPMAESSLWLKGEDSCKGRYVYADKNWDLWLVGPGHEKTKLARLQVEGERPETVSCMFSPDAKYLFCGFGRSIGEPHINWAGETYYFDLRGREPTRLHSECSLGKYGLVGWYSNETGILHALGSDLLWTDLPSLQTRTIATLPDNCQFVDFVRRDATSPRGKQN